jgi:hypothetical protein
MEDTLKLLKLAFAIIVFCIGFTIMSYESKTFHVITRTTREKFKAEELYQQFNDLDRNTVSRSELIAALFHPLDYDIMIDGAIIRKSEHNNDFIAGYGINEEEYIKTYQYDLTGKVILITYEGTEG